MSDKQAMIKQLLDMQKKFIDFEHKNGVTAADLYAADENHELHNFSKDYIKLAMELCDTAHADKNSHR